MSRASFLPIALLAALAVATPAAAQLGQSEGYKMLDAVRKSDGDALNKMLNKPGVTVVNYKDPSSGEGAIHVVVKRSDATYLRFLLGHGADANMRDGKGNTPLMIAVENSFESGIEILVKAGASVNLANASGETPLIRAVQLRDLGMVHALLAAGADPDKADVIAGRSARDYARLDTRAPEITKEIAATPKKVKRDVSGPTLSR